MTVTLDLDWHGNNNEQGHRVIVSSFNLAILREQVSPLITLKSPTPMCTALYECYVEALVLRLVSQLGCSTNAVLIICCAFNVRALVPCRFHSVNGKKVANIITRMRNLRLGPYRTITLGVEAIKELSRWIWAGAAISHRGRQFEEVLASNETAMNMDSPHVSGTASSLGR